jgi:hypothetical protein
MLFRLGGTLLRHSAPYLLISQPVTNPDDAYDSDGVFRSPEPTSTTCRGSIQPLSARWLQLDGGKYTEDDRALYTTSKHQNGAVIEYQGQRYQVDGVDERPDYCDVNKYLLKRVSVHA